MSIWEQAARGKVLTTGIGSLPHAFVDAALNFSFRCRIPFLPQMPIRNPREFMISQAIEQLPGLREEGDGYATLDYASWEKGTALLRDQTEAAFRSSAPEAFEDFEPSPGVWGGYRPFLYELVERKVPFAKIQLAGPLTTQWALRFTDGGIADRNPEVGIQIFRLVLARAVAMCRRLKTLGTTPLIFIDEPGLYGFSAANPRHGMALQELSLFLQTLRKEGALVGLHCCSNTDWPAILNLPLDVLSIDTNLSLNLLLTHLEDVRRFLNAGGRLSLGVVPTGGHAVKIRSFKPELLLDRLLDTLQAHVGRDTAFLHQLLSSAILTPACGLALHSIPDAEAILGELLEVADLLEAFLRHG